MVSILVQKITMDKVNKVDWPIRFFLVNVGQTMSEERSLLSLTFFFWGLRITFPFFESFIVTLNPLPSVNNFYKGFHKALKSVFA